jgi:hypothetical protein
VTVSVFLSSANKTLLIEPAGQALPSPTFEASSSVNPGEEIENAPSTGWVPEVKPDLCVDREGLRFEAHASRFLKSLCWCSPPLWVIMNRSPVRAIKNVSSGRINVTRNFDPPVLVKEPGEVAIERNIGLNDGILLNVPRFACDRVDDVTNVPAEVSYDVPV